MWSWFIIMVVMLVAVVGSKQCVGGIAVSQGLWGWGQGMGDLFPYPPSPSPQTLRDDCGECMYV